VGYNVAMLYMVIEEYRHGPGPVYERAASRGRMLPEGLRYVDSWVIDNGQLDRCFQLMETDSPELLDAWRAQWEDLVDFDVLPVITSSEAAQRSGARRPPAPSADGIATPGRPELPAAS
jgi:uncharacterized protein DUF3303